MNEYTPDRQSGIPGTNEAGVAASPPNPNSVVSGEETPETSVTPLRPAARVYNGVHPAGVLIPLLGRVQGHAYLINGQLNIFDNVSGSDELRDQLRDAIYGLTDRGVSTCLICHPDQLHMHGRLDFLRRLDDHPEAEVRISAAPVYGLFVLDSSTAVVWGKSNKREVIVAKREAISESSLRLAEVTWDQACPLGFYLEYTFGRLSDILPKVLHTLSSGCTDEVAARQLQISVRTYRRHVALLTERLGAKSRFEAGVRAGSLGLFGTPPDTELVI